jgi:hypothetical protein
MGESQGSNFRIIWLVAFFIGWALTLPVLLLAVMLARGAVGTVGLIAVVLPIAAAWLAARTAFRRGAPHGIWGGMLLGALLLGPAIYRISASSGEPAIGILLIAFVVVAPPLVVALYARRLRLQLGQSAPA